MKKTPWTDDTIIPWGDHKGERLEDIPAHYLLWLSKQDWISDWPGLHAYLKDNSKILEEEQKAQKEEDDAAHNAGFDTWDDYLRYNK